MPKSPIDEIRTQYAGKTFVTKRAALFDHDPAPLQVYFGRPGELEPAMAASFGDELKHLGALDARGAWRAGAPVPIAQISAAGEAEGIDSCFAFLLYDPKDAKRPIIIATSDDWSGRKRLADLSKLALVAAAEGAAAVAAAPPIKPSKEPVPKGIDAAGIYVYSGSNADLRSRVMAEIRARWADATSLADGDPRAVRTEIHSGGKKKALAYAVSPVRDGWILVVDSSGDNADFKLAKRFAKQLETDVVWWVISADCRDGALRRIGAAKQSSAGYEKVGAYVAALPFGWTAFTKLAEAGDGDFCAFEIHTFDYDFGPAP